MSSHTLKSHALSPLTILAVVLTAMLGGCSDPAEPDDKVNERIRPVARFVMEGDAEAVAPAAAAPAAAAPAEKAAPVAASAKKDGATVYAQTCKVCHDIGLSGAPKKGDKAAWAPRIATGMDTLYQTSISGKNAMPPKGGNGSLSAEEVKGAVDYMVAAAQ